MHLTLIRSVYLFLLLLLFAACEVAPTYVFSDPSYRMGDSLAWAEPDYDASAWPTSKGDTGDSVFWVRQTVELPQMPAATQPLGINVRTFGAFEVYWDGKLLGNNGYPATNSTAEIPGTESSYFIIPPDLTQEGKHTVALRATQTSMSEHLRGLNVIIADYFKLVRAPLIATALAHILAGAFLIAGIYYAFLFFSSKRSLAVLLFSITCFLFFGLIMLEYVKFYYEIPYNHFYTRLEIIGILTLLIAFLVPAYFSLQFSFSHKGIFLALLTAVLLGVYFLFYEEYDRVAQLHSMSMWVASLLLVADAYRRKETGAALVLIGLLISGVLHYFLYYDISVFISFTIIVLCMLFILAIRIKEQERAYQASLLLSARLKNELLRKNIQPHFLMNTLTSLIDWVEEAPKEGVRFIEALAGEFSQLNRVADHKLVPVTEEVALCESHLAVMSYRKEIDYRFATEGIKAQENVPPAIFHTLLENGITHSMPLEDGSIGFLLRYQELDQQKQYDFITLAKNRSSKNAKEGTGFAYIRSRLQESFGDNWKLQSEAVPEGWKTTITLYP